MGDSVRCELTLQASRSPEATPAHSMRGDTGP